jgi:hypothetical protein
VCGSDPPEAPVDQEVAKGAARQRSYPRSNPVQRDGRPGDPVVCDQAASSQGRVRRGRPLSLNPRMNQPQDGRFRRSAPPWTGGGGTRHSTAGWRLIATGCACSWRHRWAGSDRSAFIERSLRPCWGSGAALCQKPEINSEQVETLTAQSQVRRKFPDKGLPICGYIYKIERTMNIEMRWHLFNPDGHLNRCDING